MSRYVSAATRPGRRPFVLTRNCTTALLAVLMPVLAACAATPTPPDAPVVAALIVKPRTPSASDEVVRAVRKPLGSDAGVRYARPLAGDAHLVYITAPATREQVPGLIERLRASAQFQYVEPDSMMKIQ